MISAAGRSDLLIELSRGLHINALPTDTVPHSETAESVASVASVASGVASEVSVASVASEVASVASEVTSVPEPQQQSSNLPSRTSEESNLPAESASGSQHADEAEAYPAEREQPHSDEEDSEALPADVPRGKGQAVVDGVLHVQSKYELTLYCEGITSIVVDAGVCNDPAVRTWRLEPFGELQFLHISDKSFRFLEELKMEGMKCLEQVTIGSFVGTGEGEIVSERQRCALRIIQCPCLVGVKIDCDSFSYWSEFRLQGWCDGVE